MINLSGTDSIIECMHGESLPEDVVRMYCYIQVGVRIGGKIDSGGALYGAGFVHQYVLLHSGFTILVFVLAVVMMVVMLVIFDILVMKLFCCFYMQIKSSGYYFTQVIFF